VIASQGAIRLPDSPGLPGFARLSPGCRPVRGEDFLHSHQGRTFGAPGLTAQAVEGEGGREQSGRKSGQGDPP